jgi:branched-chain amino acid transport system permease protein
MLPASRDAAERTLGVVGLRLPSAESSWSFQPSRFVRAVFWIVLAAFLVALLAGDFSAYLVFTITTVAVYAVAAIGQDWLIGQAGQVSLGGGAFMSIGAFTVVVTAGSPFHQWPVQLVLAGLVGGGAGLIVGVTALRLRRFYLLLASLAFIYIVLTVTEQYQGLNAGGFTIAPPSIGSWTITSSSGLLVFCLILLAATAYFTASLQRRAPGRYWRAIRENELAASSLGIHVVRWKLLAFIGSSAVTAIAGAMYAWTAGLVTYNTFTLQFALSLAVMVFFGGRASMLGPIIGATAVTLLPQGLNNLANSFPGSSGFGQWLTLNNGVLVSGIYGLVLLLILLLEPQGVLGLVRRVGLWIDALHWFAPPRGVTGTRVTGTGDSASAGSAGPALDLQEDGALRAIGRVLDRMPAAEPGEVPTPVAGARAMAIQLDHVGVRYPNGAVGVEDLTLSIPQGSVVGLIGRNGAGKTSSIRAIAGFPLNERIQVLGQVRIREVTMNRHDPRTMRSAGVVLVPERDKAFPSLTVMEHFRLAGVPSAEVDRQMEVFPVLQRLRHRRAGFLSGGERQTLALATATAVHPKVLLIDEPSLGLSPLMTQTLIGSLLQLRTSEPDMTIVLTEQATEALKSVADYFYVLDGGRAIYSGHVDVLSRREVREAVMGQ